MKPMWPRHMFLHTTLSSQQFSGIIFAVVPSFMKYFYCFSDKLFAGPNLENYGSIQY